MSRYTILWALLFGLVCGGCPNAPSADEDDDAIAGDTSGGDSSNGAGDSDNSGDNGGDGAAEDDPDSPTAQVLAIVNDERAAQGLAPLTRNAALDAAAERHAADMRDNGFFDHTGSDGSTVAVRAGDAGYAWSLVGENIAWGYPTPDAVMVGWMNSDGHRANILNAGFTEIGLAIEANGSPLWVQVFAAPQ